MAKIDNNINYIEWDSKHRQYLIRLAGDEHSQEERLNKMKTAEDMYEALKAMVAELKLHTTRWDLLMISLIQRCEEILAQAEGK